MSTRPTAGSSAPCNQNKQARHKKGGAKRKKQSDPLQAFETNLRSWRLRLLNDRDGSAALVDHVLKRLSDKGRFHPSELSRFKTHMMNGVTCPGEYGISDNYGCIKVSC